jgi:hypothetical protein
MSTFDELTPALEKIEAAIHACTQVPRGNAAERERVEAALCLATREAFSDFHSLCLVNEHLDLGAKERLDRLLAEAIRSFAIDDFTAAVTRRHQDFLEFCDLMDRADGLDELALDLVANDSSPD